MLPLIALFAIASPSFADGWDESDAKKTLEWLAKATPDKDEAKQKAFFKELIGKKVQWPVILRAAHKDGYATVFAPAWPQSDCDELMMKWRLPTSDDLRDAVAFSFKTTKKIPTQIIGKAGTARDTFPADADWIKKQTRGDTGILAGTIAKIEMSTYIVPLTLPDQKKKTLYTYTVTIDGKIGPKE